MNQIRLALPLIFSQFLIFAETKAQVATQEIEVWQLEKEYYSLAKDNNLEGHLSLFHEDNIGWPALDSLPKGKDQVGLWIPMVNNDPSRKWNYEIQLQAIKSYDRVVVVHYKLHEYFTNPETGEEITSAHYKIAHTWLYEDNKWQIISGMGGILN